MQLDVEWTVDIPVKKRNSKGVCYLFEFVWLKILVMKYRLKTKFVTFTVKLHNVILLSIF